MSPFGTPVLAGQGVVMGSLFGVAATAAAQGEPFEAALKGVFVLPKADVAVSLGAAVYWLEAVGAVTTEETGNRLIGAATNGADAEAPSVAVRLNGFAG
ncbi:hypothetical protein A9O63_20895 [Cereibacter johrii]|nr:hypothetical protein A9O63_20895 [Cereibacter johrii]